MAASSSPATQSGLLNQEPRVPRLAFTIAETAEILGISYATVNRLMMRGLLRPSRALHKPLIAKAEIERFLKETTADS